MRLFGCCVCVVTSCVFWGKHSCISLYLFTPKRFLHVFLATLLDKFSPGEPLESWCLTDVPTFDICLALTLFAIIYQRGPCWTMLVECNVAIWDLTWMPAFNFLSSQNMNNYSTVCAAWCFEGPRLDCWVIKKKTASLSHGIRTTASFINQN